MNPNVVSLGFDIPVFVQWMGERSLRSEPPICGEGFCS